ncbi:hypothetical protein [Micromonospora yangpuensis]|uniref:Uncharacterized protein n=1 Tax=Micromonospora yangpuensis TaxID=683228 RepID=A0A1C6VDX7_9ACTN|nr:hypothetical protein [Micromonospora yangpuensis]GGM14254.1 hypothetical protein GCM10012279_35480 [Micromonospora yangpuensis]SCL64569.1 hypothetical protein GA0070617_5504 [Micromonospora yangpuensis]
MATRKIRMRTRYASESQAIEPGQIGAVDVNEAKTLVDGGYAVYLADDGTDQKPTRTTPGKKARTQTPPSDGDEVPDGSITTVMAWIGDNRDRAAAALQAEQAKGDRARVKLVEDLTKLLADGDDGQQ